MSRAQLLELGLTRRAIEHRLAIGRLHRVFQGVYAVGRAELTRRGRWSAAILACGDGATLSHESAAAAWGIRDCERRIEISTPNGSGRKHPGIRLHRRTKLRPEDITKRNGIPLTSLALTLVDLAARVPQNQLEAAIREADKLDFVDPEQLRVALETMPARRGVAKLARTLDRHTFRLTDSELERRFLALVRKTGLPMPETQATVNGFRVDFYWPDLNLVVETDGLRYHRTASQQAADASRDQAHAAAGTERLRFSHAQLAHEAERSMATLRAVVRRLSHGEGR